MPTIYRLTRLLLIVALLLTLPGLFGMAQSAAAQVSLGQTFEWLPKNLTIEYPEAWTARVLGELNDDVLGLAADPAALTAMTTGGSAPSSPMILVVLTEDPTPLVGPGVVAATVQETAANYAAQTVGSTATLVGDRVAGAEAVRITGVSSQSSMSVMVEIAYVADQWLFVLAALPIPQQEQFTPLYEAIVYSLCLGEIDSLTELTATAAWEPAALTIPHPVAWSVEPFEQSLVLAEQRIDFTRLQFNMPLPPEGTLLVLSTRPGDDLTAAATAALQAHDGAVTTRIETLWLAGHEAVRITGHSEALGTRYLITAALVNGQAVLIEGRAALTCQDTFTTFYDAVLGGLTLAGQGGGLAVQTVEVLTP